MRHRKPNFSELFQPLRASVRRRAAPSHTDHPALQAIWDVVSAIPRGQVSTYGAVARAAGLPGRARQAGLALKVAPEDLQLPWHRVVGAGGRIVFARTTRQYREQTRQLRADGVAVKAGRVAAEAMTDLEDLHR